jgi:transposase
MSWRQGQPHSQDLRDRVLAAVDEGTAIAAVAALFRLDRSYIYKALARRRLTGETAARPQRCHLPRKLAPYHAAIRAHVAVCRDATLDELCRWLLETHGVSSSQGGMWNTLARLGLTLKKRRAARPSRRGPTSPRQGRLGASARRG